MQGETLYNECMALTNDPTSPYYHAYSTATNSAVLDLANQYGLDTSGGITDDWISSNAYLKNYYIIGNDGTPQKPTKKKGTKEQWQAYCYYKLVQDEPTTRQAELEWKSVQEEAAYWANRPDRNYTASEIINEKIDWSKYPTLKKMDEKAALGAPTTLNRAVGYNKDDLEGVIWASRNGGSSGDAITDSVYAAMGAGNVYREDPVLRARLDPSSDTYNPYVVGSTADDVCLYFGINSVSKDWLDENAWMAGSSDKEMRDMYTAAEKAYTNSATAEEELAWLNEIL